MRLFWRWFQRLLLTTFSFLPLAHSRSPIRRIGLRLFAFLATAVIAGQLSERARRETIHANQRRREIEHLYAFSQRLLTLESVPELLNLVPRHIAETFGASGAALFVSDRTDIYRSDPDAREIETARLQSVAGTRRTIH